MTQNNLIFETKEYSSHSIDAGMSLLIDKGYSPIGGKFLLSKRIEDLKKSKELIQDRESPYHDEFYKWDDSSFTLADAYFTYKNLAKFQTDSSFLSGIKGIVFEDNNGSLAIDANSVSAGIYSDNWKYFEPQFRQHARVFCHTEDKNYGLNVEGRGWLNYKTIDNVVLFPYTEKTFEQINSRHRIFRDSPVSFTKEQFDSIFANEINLNEIPLSSSPLEVSKINPNNTAKEIGNPLWELYPSSMLYNFVKRDLEVREHLLSKQINKIGLLNCTLPKINFEDRARMFALNMDCFDYAHPISFTLSQSHLRGNLIGIKN